MSKVEQKITALYTSLRPLSDNDAAALGIDAGYGLIERIQGMNPGD